MLNWVSVVYLALTFAWKNGSCGDGMRTEYALEICTGYMGPISSTKLPLN